MQDYMKKAKDHFLNPRNVGEIGDPDGVGETRSLAFGDAVRLTFKLDENKRIKDVKFKASGGASAIAFSSALTEILKGMTLEEAEKLTNRDIANYLGVPPEDKMYYWAIGTEALEAAIANYRSQRVQKEDLDVVCKCFGTVDKEIERVVRNNNLRTVKQVTYYTKAGGGCGECHSKIEASVEKVKKEEKEGLPPGPKRKKLTNVQKIKLIEETLRREIVPALNADRGDIELIDIKGNTVYVALRGSCSSCHGSEFTIKHYVEAKLKEFVWDEIVVEEVRPNQMESTS